MALRKDKNGVKEGFNLDRVNLEQLTFLARKALSNPKILRQINFLKEKILESEESFIWRVLSEQLLEEKLPNGIRSGWIFVLKPNTHTPSHYHPNSVQYTLVIEGSGKIEIGQKKMTIPDLQSNEGWYVIPKNVPHAVTVKEKVMVVLSFHTCPSNELLEIETQSGRSRYYARL